MLGDVGCDIREALPRVDAVGRAALGMPDERAPGRAEVCMNLTPLEVSSLPRV